MTDELAVSRMDERALQDLTAQVSDYWLGMLVDTKGDELSQGGQSLKELERIEAFEAFLLRMEQGIFPTFHHFSDGIYMREVHVSKDSVIIGHEHRHECLNVMLQGRVLTISNGTVQEFAAPYIVKSGAHTRKASVVVEDMRWATVHPNPTNETDIKKLEEMLLIKSRSFLEYERENTP